MMVNIDKQTDVMHPTRRVCTYDSSINSLIMVVYEKDFFKVQSEFFVQGTTKKIFS